MSPSSAHPRAGVRFRAAWRLSALALVLATTLGTVPAHAQAIRHAGDCHPSRDPRTPMPADCQKRRQQAVDEMNAREAAERARSKADEQGQAQAAHWREGAKPISQERAEELEQQIRALLENLPAYGTPGAKYSKQAFATLTDKLPPLLIPLAGSAYIQAQSIPAGARGRAAFDHWDRGAGGRAVTLLYAVARRWPADMRLGEPTRTMIQDTWGAYRDQMDDKGTLDPGFMARIRAGLPALRARQAEQAPRAEAPRQTRTETSIVFLRPDEVASYTIGHAMGQAAGEIVKGRAQMKQTFDGVETGLRESRQAFWKCYAVRCADPAPPYVAYSQFLEQKDHLIALVESRDAALRKMGGDAAMMNAYSQVMNTREIDGGPVNGCENDYDRWQARISQSVKETKLADSFNPAAARRMSEVLFKGAEYIAVQTCRDKMEFALRPR